MSYEVGQIFTDPYPFDCAIWCNENGLLLNEIDPLEDGTRQFKICEPDPLTLDEVKTNKHNELKNVMTTKRQVLKVDYDDDQFDANETAQANMIVLLKSFDLGAASVSIRSATEKTHSFNQAQCNELALLMASAVNNLYGEYWQHKDALAKCTTKEEVEAIVWN